MGIAGVLANELAELLRSLISLARPTGVEPERWSVALDCCDSWSVQVAIRQIELGKPGFMILRLIVLLLCGIRLKLAVCSNSPGLRIPMIVVPRGWRGAAWAGVGSVSDPNFFSHERGCRRQTKRYDPATTR